MNYLSTKEKADGKKGKPEDIKNEKVLAIRKISSNNVLKIKIKKIWQESL